MNPGAKADYATICKISSIMMANYFTFRSKTALARPALAIFILALAMRLEYLRESMANPTFFCPTVDAYKYVDMARAFAQGHGLTPEYFKQSFFYPFYLSLVFRLCHSSILVAKVLQMVFGAVACVLIALLGKRLAGRAAGLTAGLIAAFYGPLIYYDGELLGAGWSVLWGTLLLLLLARIADEKKPRSRAIFFLFGLSGACAVLTQATFMPFFIIACVWLAWRWRRQQRDPWKIIGLAALFIAAGFALPALPAAWLARQTTGRASILPGYSGLNLYFGNNPQSAAMHRIRPGVDWDRLKSLPARHGCRTPEEAERYYLKLVRDYALYQPLNFARGLGGKTLELISSRELPNSEDMYLFRQWSPTLRLVLWKIGPFGFPFGLLLLLATVGLTRREERAPCPLFLYLALFALAIVGTHTCARYRMPMIPPLIILAAMGLRDLWQWARVRAWKPLGAMAAILVVFVPLVSLPGPFPQERIPFPAEIERYLGLYAERAGRLNEAITHDRRSLELDPANVDVHLALGSVLARAKQQPQAIEQYEQALRLEPDCGKISVRYATTLAAMHQPARAIALLEKAIQTDPFCGEAYLVLGQLQADQGHLTVAEAHFRKVLAIDPDDAAGHTELGYLLLVEGHPEPAIEHLRTALALNPQSQAAHAYLRRALATLQSLSRP